MKLIVEKAAAFPPRLNGRLPPKQLAAMYFSLFPRRSRRYDYRDMVRDDYRALVEKKSAYHANKWLIGVIQSELRTYIPTTVDQVLIALAVAALVGI